MRPQREPVVVVIKLILWHLRLLDALWHQWTRMHACERAVPSGWWTFHWLVMCSAHGGKDAQWSNARRRLMCPLRVGSLKTFECPMRGGYYDNYYSSEAPQIEHKWLSISLLSAHRGSVPPVESR